MSPSLRNAELVICHTCSVCAPYHKVLESLEHVKETPASYSILWTSNSSPRPVETVLHGVAVCMGTETGLVLKDKVGNVLAFFPWDVEPVALRQEPEDAVPSHTLH